MKAKEVLKILNVSRLTLHNYVKQGKIKLDNVINSRHYEYNAESVYALIGKKIRKKKQVVISYARVSTQKQRKQLAEQNQRLYDSAIARGLVLEHQYKDIKSGMSGDRDEFNEMIRRIVKGEIGTVVVENKDRLCRFGFEILERIFSYFGCTILVLNDNIPNKSYEHEITEDVIAILHYFSMKNYSHRRKLNRLRKELENIPT